MEVLITIFIIIAGMFMLYVAAKLHKISCEVEYIYDRVSEWTVAINLTKWKQEAEDKGMNNVHKVEL